ncbi:MAG: hypothetical protein FWE14_04160 [Lachnospiraceae bacterium]|nr:hypothetical protein [Lachnospiraceae bacterium]
MKKSKKMNYGTQDIIDKIAQILTEKLNINSLPTIHIRINLEKLLSTT